MILSVRLNNIEKAQLDAILEYYNNIHHIRLNRSDIIRIIISEIYQMIKKDSG